MLGGCPDGKKMFQKNERVFLPGSSGEPSALVNELLGTTGVEVTTSFVPGINDLAARSFGAGTLVSGFFMQPGLSDAQRSGCYRHLPYSYAGIVKWLNQAEAFDCCVVQVTPPDKSGICSLGMAAEFTPLVLRRARRIVAVINKNVPYILNSPRVNFGDIAAFIESTTPIIGYNIGAIDDATRLIAKQASEFIADGAILQLGLGRVPAAILLELTDRRNLRFHTGMLSDGVMALAASGALDESWQHKTTVILGEESLYRWATNRTDIHVLGCDETHDLARLAEIDNFIAINSALEVDLFGQCNLEFADGHAVSGPGGAPDFARAGKLSKGGLSIVALPATFGRGNRSRIKPVLGLDAIVTLSRTDVDIIITEHGIADIRNSSVHERAAAIIKIASPLWRENLEEEWQKIKARL